MKISKVLTAALASASMLASGLVAIAPAAAAPMGEAKFNVMVNREFDVQTPLVVRPGENAIISVNFTIDERWSNPVITPVTDIAVGDVLTFADNLTTTATLPTANVSWYGTPEMGAGCYEASSAFGSSMQATWSAEMETCGPKYLSVYRQVNYTNNTLADVTFSANPTLTSTGSTAEWLDSDAGVTISMTASISVDNTTSYTAAAGDGAFNFNVPKSCVAHDLAVGDRFHSVVNFSNGSGNLPTTSGSGAYVSSLSGSGNQNNWSTSLNDTVELASYEISANRWIINTAEPHGLMNGVQANIEGTGVTELDSVDTSYLYVVDADSLYFWRSAADMAETSLTGGTVTYEGDTTFAVEDPAASMTVVSSGMVADLVVGDTYQLETDLVRVDDASVSVARPCGLAAPSFTVTTPIATYSTIPVIVSGVAGAYSYQCRAVSGGTTVTTGYISESNLSTPAGGTCNLNNLSGSTTYQVSVAAYSQLEGQGEWGPATSYTTPAGGGGGGGGTPQVIGVLEALTGATSPNAAAAVTRTLHASSVIAPMSRGYVGANGDVLYAGIDAGTMKVTRALSTGADTRFAGTGVVTIPNVLSVRGVSWMGASGSSWAVSYMLSGGAGTGFKWGKNNTAAGIKTQVVTSAQTAAFCAAQFGSSYNTGYASLLNSSIEAPLVSLNCMNMNDPLTPGQYVLATIKVATGATSPYVLVTKLSSATSAAPCVTTSFGRNPNAKTSTSAALAVVVTTYAKTNGMCSQGTTPTKREIITVSYAGKKLKSTLATTSQIAANTAFMSIAPGFAANTWVGATVIMPSMQPSQPGHLFTIDALAKVTKKANITFNTGASNASFSSYSSVSVLKAVSATNIAGVRIGSAGGGLSQSWAASTISLTTGKVTTGKVATVSAANYTGYQSGQNINLVVPTVDFKKLNLFALTDVASRQYKVVTWTQATR